MSKNLRDITPDKLLWLDLEMTGLQSSEDRILELAAIVTDWEFHELATLETGIKQDAVTIERLWANPFAAGRPSETRELITHSQTGVSENEAELRLLELIDQFFQAGQPVLLAGNSIHTDRQFIRQYWPRVEKRLHYRMLDVSAWKVVMIGKYDLQFQKQEKHRALDDIRESIAELQFYLKRCGVIHEANS